MGPPQSGAALLGGRDLHPGQPHSCAGLAALLHHGGALCTKSRLHHTLSWGFLLALNWHHWPLLTVSSVQLYGTSPV